MSNTASEHPPEQILVIPAGLAEALANYKVFGPSSPILEQIILDNHSFREREEAETNLAYKQVIPYVMVVYTGDGETSYLVSQRTKKQQEKRLHDLMSLGQGGHINQTDFEFAKGQTPQSPIVAGLMREMQEEYSLTDIREVGPVGVINDNSNEVGKVHLGLVYRLRVGSREYKVAEEGKHIAQWAFPAALEQHYDRMESWSKILMDHVIRPA